MARARIIRLDEAQQFTAINVLSDPGAVGGAKLVPSCAQILINWSVDSGKIAHNVLYGRYTGPFAGSTTQAQAIYAALTSGAAWTALVALLSPNCSITGVTLRDVNTAGNALIASTGASIPGTSAGSPFPSEAAICVTLRTAKVGPQNRGRMYLPGWTSNSMVNTGNLITPATITAVQNWVSGFTSIFAGQGYTWVLGQPARAQYTGSTGTVHPARAATSTPITSVTVRDNHWDSMRRRGLR